MKNFGRAKAKQLRCCMARDKERKNTPRSNRRNIPTLPIMPRIDEQTTLFDAEASDGSLNSVGVQISKYQFAANDPCEDFQVVFENQKSLLVGVFDGHGGPAASELGSETIFTLFSDCLRKVDGNVGEALRLSLVELDDLYLQKVDRLRMGDNSADYLQHLGAGSCALLLHLDKADGSYHAANLGDSRMVLGKQCPHLPGLLEAVALTVDHSCKTDSERHRLSCEHSEDDSIIKQRWDEVEYAWLLKGRARFTRSVGDLIFKDPMHAEFYNACIADESAHRRMLPLPDPKQPYLSNRAEISQRRAVQGDDFLLIASDGLWDEVPNDMAVSAVGSLVAQHGRNSNVAKLLVQFALERIARRLAHEEPELEVNQLADLEALPPGREGRRGLHDDISVVVIFFEQNNLPAPSAPMIGSAPWSHVSGGNDFTPRDQEPLYSNRSTELDSNRSMESTNGMMSLHQSEVSIGQTDLESFRSRNETPRTARSTSSIGETGDWFGPSLHAKTPWVDVRKSNNKSHLRPNDGSQTARRQTLLNEWAVLSGVQVAVLEKAFNAISPKPNGVMSKQPGEGVVRMQDHSRGNEMLENLILEARSHEPARERKQIKRMHDQLYALQIQLLAMSKQQLGEPAGVLLKQHVVDLQREVEQLVEVGCTPTMGGEQMTVDQQLLINAAIQDDELDELDEQMRAVHFELAVERLTPDQQKRSPSRTSSPPQKKSPSEEASDVVQAASEAVSAANEEFAVTAPRAGVRTPRGSTTIMHRVPLELADFDPSQSPLVPGVLQNAFEDAAAEGRAETSEERGTSEGESTEGEDEEETSAPREGDVNWVYRLPAELADLQQQDKGDQYI